MSSDEIIGALCAIFILSLFSFFVFMSVLANNKERMRMDAFFKCVSTFVDSNQMDKLDICVEQFPKDKK